MDESDSALARGPIVESTISLARRFGLVLLTLGILAAPIGIGTLRTSTTGNESHAGPATPANWATEGS